MFPPRTTCDKILSVIREKYGRREFYRVPDEIRDEIAQRFAEGVRREVLAVDYGVSHATVCNILKKKRPGADTHGPGSPFPAG
jgi:hypothetical protein